jgi:uncharacterized membrane protein
LFLKKKVCIYIITHWRSISVQNGKDPFPFLSVFSKLLALPTRIKSLSRAICIFKPVTWMHPCSFLIEE